MSGSVQAETAPAKTRWIHPGNLLFFIPAVILFIKLPDSEHLLLETLVCLGVVAISAISSVWVKWPATPPAWCDPLRRLSRRPALACLLPGVLSVALRLALLPWLPVPDPIVPDEYSHLFLAKTFEAGRLANPPHALWQHFETLQVISQPTFSSMYLAGQACFLVLGKAIAGHEFAGVLLSTALMCSVMTWFLRAYLPPGWALWGGVFAAVRFGAASYWNNSYWGGSVAALGGALALGAFPRLTQKWRPVHAVAFVTGLLLVVNTRPWEGLALGLILGIATTVELFRAPRITAKSIRTSAAVALSIAALGGLGMALHFKAVTGNAFTVPYQVNQRQYGWPMSLPWFPVRSIEYRHPELALYQEWEIGQHEMVTKLAHIPAGLLVKFNFLWRFYFGVVGFGAFLFADRIWRNRRQRVIWLATGGALLALALEQTGYPHYIAPAAPAMVLFVVAGVRRLMHCRIRRLSLGPPVVYSIIPVMLIIVGVQAFKVAPGGPPGTGIFVTWCCLETREFDRQPIVRQLRVEPGDHLVFVRYEHKAFDTNEWVYNEPDIDSSRIVFARDMGAAKNQELIRYYPRRRVWSVVVMDRKAAMVEIPAANGHE